MHFAKNGVFSHFLSICSCLVLKIIVIYTKVAVNTVLLPR